MRHILLIDNNPGQIPELVHKSFLTLSHRVSVARTGAEGIMRVRADPPHVILLDVSLPDQSGLDVFSHLTKHNGCIPIIFITGVKRADRAIEAIKRGAYDYLFKPLELNRLRWVVSQALNLGRQMHEVSIAAEPPPLDQDREESSLVGTSPAMCDVYKAIGQVAAQDVSVLITGESGTGKELVARAIYQHSDRAKEKFLALNCAAIPEPLLESELFGHEKGAFTGAERKRIGKFEQCHGGTLFLDEIGDMPLLTQAKMLRVMQEQAFERVGSNETIRTDVRVIAATHRNLKAWSADGRFRPDLYYRLGVFTIHLPPLRERCEDLQILVPHFLRRFGRELGREVHEIAPEAMELLRGYSWPGNIRELQSILKQALLQTTGPVLLPAFLPPLHDGIGEAMAPVKEATGLEALIRDRLGSDTGNLHDEVHSYVDRFLLSRVLEHTGGSQRQAARRLGIARETLRRRLLDLALRTPHDSEFTEEDYTSNCPSRDLAAC